MPFVLLFLGSLSLLGFSDQLVTAYQGLDNNRPCFLYLHQETKNGSGTYQVEVSTSYEHNGQGLGKVWLQFPEGLPSKMLVWERPETGESLRVLLKNEETILEGPQAFRVRWMHFDHLHDSTCSKLQKVDQQ